MKKIKNNKGITLVALIITIIVLLILAVVAISAVNGDGIISKAKNARTNYQTAQDEENLTLAGYLAQIEENANEKENDKKESIIPGVTFSGYYTEYDYHNVPVESSLVVEEKTLTWEELNNSNNAIKYGYRMDFFSNENLSNELFSCCTNLVSIVIPSTIISVDDSPIPYCKSIKVDKNNNYYSDIDGVLFNKDKTKLIEYPNGKNETNYIIPSTVEIIGKGAFGDTRLKSITIPSSVITIDNDAFQSSSLETVTIPNSVTSIGRFAFRYCENLTNISIPSSVTSIGDGAFGSCENINKITVGDDSVKTLVQNSGYTKTIIVDSSIN